MKNLIVNFLGAALFSAATLFYFITPLHDRYLRQDAGEIITVKVVQKSFYDTERPHESAIKFKRIVYWQDVDVLSRIFLLFNVNWKFLRSGSCALWGIQKLTGHGIQNIVTGLEAARIAMDLPLRHSLRYADGTPSAMSSKYLISHGYEYADMKSSTPDLPQSLDELVTRFDNSFVKIISYDGIGHAFPVIDGVIYDQSDYFIRNIGFSPGTKFLKIILSIRFFIRAD